MKKRLLFATAVAMACTMMTSCVKGDDWEMLNHSFKIEGEMHPTFGIPVGEGEMNMNDLLSNLSASYNGYIDTTGDMIVVQYGIQTSDTVFGSNYLPNNKGGKKLAPKFQKASVGAKADAYTKDTVLENTLDIDFFNDVDMLENIEITHVWAKVILAIKGYLGTNDALLSNLHITFDEFEIWYDAPGYNTSQQFIDPALATLSFNIDGDDIDDGLLDSVKIDMASMVNKRPSRIFARYHLKLRVDPGIITQNVSTMTIQEIIDELTGYANNAWISYSADMQFKMPLTMKIDNMHYDFDVDLGEGISSINLDSILKEVNEGLSAEITLSEFTLVLENGIPLSLNLSATGYSAAGLPVCNLFSNELIPAANVGDPDGDNVYEAISASDPHRITASLNRTDLDNLSKAKTLKVSITINSDSKHVIIKRTDVLKLKAFLKVHPTLNVNIEM